MALLPAVRMTPRVAALREAVLQRKQWHNPPTLASIDARAWLEHPAGEDWLIWRARRTVKRLEMMPIQVEPTQPIAGRPQMRMPTKAEERRNREAGDILAAVAPFPGGDYGHFQPDFGKLLRLGTGGLVEEIRARRSDCETEDKRIFYDACEMAMLGLSSYALRTAEEWDKAADKNGTSARAMRRLAAICRRISTEPPSTFHEALELMFLTIIALTFGEDHGLTTPGRMDQTLQGFYEADLAAGRISREEALELICCFFVQLNEVVWNGAALSVIVGGRDGAGNDVTNDLTYLCLEARLATKLAYPTVGIAWHEGTPRELTDFGCRMIATGLGDPAFFNDELISQGLRRQGVSEADSCNYMNSTCVEIKPVGTANIWVASPYFSTPQALLDVMREVAAGAIPAPATLDEFEEAVADMLAVPVREAAEANHRIWHQRPHTGCFPLASCLIADCLEKGEDIDRGGARYNWVENSFVGLANLTDSLVAIKRLVYESRELSMAEFHEILQADFRGHEPLRQRILNRFPSYGNDCDEADEIASRWAERFAAISESNTVGVHRYVPGMFCWIMHEVMGAATGATPDGRAAGFPLADGAGAAQGRDRTGPTASVLSTTKWSHLPMMGGLVHNLRFSPGTVRTSEDIAALVSLIETYLRRGGFEIQVNVVGAETLRDAQAHPEAHQDLLVRVAGYSDYFVHLNANMQAEVIARTEHGQ